MRRIQIHLDQAMDDNLATEARRRGLSKAALTRMLLAQRMQSDAVDPTDAVIGAGDGQNTDDIDAAVYSR